MKDFLVGALLVSAVITCIIGFVYFMRVISAAGTPITVHQVKPGVSCAAMVTTDGAAISCWKD